MLYLNYLFSRYLQIVKRFGSLRERRYISVHYYYYYYYYYYIELLRTQTSFSLGVNLRAKEGGNFLLPSQTKPFYP